MRSLLTLLAVGLVAGCRGSCPDDDHRHEHQHEHEHEHEHEHQHESGGSEPTERGGEQEAAAVMELGHMSAAWQSFDNWWTYIRDEEEEEESEHEGDFDPRFRGGVLLQLGTFFWDSDFFGEGDDAWYISQPVVIEGTTGSESLNPGEFHWINIVANWEGKTDQPIEASHVALLGQFTEGDPESDLPWAAQRRRSLHGSLRPSAVITYWFGPGTYHMQTVDLDLDHFRHEFHMADPVEVTVYRHAGDGRFEVVHTADHFGPVHSILIPDARPRGQASHGTLHDPPVGPNPGGTG